MAVPSQEALDGQVIVTVRTVREAQRTSPARRELDDADRLCRAVLANSRGLLARGDPEDLPRAGQMLEQAEDMAARVGAQSIAREAKKCRAALAAISGWPATRPQWTRSTTQT